MIGNKNPVPFKRGATFSYNAMIPHSYPAGYFRSWKVQARLKRWGHQGRAGQIADIASFWINPTTTRYLGLQHNVTEKWPIGLAELTIEFISETGFILPATTILIDVRGDLT